MLKSSIHYIAGILLVLLLPVGGFAESKAKSPVAFERFAGRDRPLYTHPQLAAFRNLKKSAVSGISIRAQDPDSGIVIYKTDSSTKRSLASSLAKQGLSEVPVYVSANGHWVAPTDTLIVQFRKDASSSEIDAFLTAHGGTMVRARRNHPNQFVVKIADPAAAMNTALEWYDSDLVEWAQANCLREAEPRFLPNDTYFFAQWHLHNTNQNGSVLHRDVGAVRAWDITRGSTNVVVAVLDDGIELNHPDLAANIFTNANDPVNGVDDDSNGFVDDVHGWDFWDGDNDPSPATADNNHGTATTGLVIAPADNGLGVAGMANRCRLLPVRVYSDTSKDIDWADSVEYAAQFADVLSISYFIDPLPASYDAIRYAVTSGRGGKGCVICTAYGNDGVLRRYMADLAAAPEVLGVSGTSNYDKRSWFGDYGPSLSMVGPAGGGNIAMITTDRMGTNGYDKTLDYTLHDLQGTSFSCPLAAGAAALIISEHPDWSGLKVRRQIEATCDKIDAEAFPYNSRGWNPQYGYGRLNVWAALTTTPATWDTFEPDNTAATAKPIEDGEQQYRSLSTGVDADWVSFTITNTADIQLTVVGATNAGLELYNAALSRIATNNSGYPSYCYLIATNLSATTYYARVFSPPGVAISNYSLHFGIQNFRDGYEPDDVLTNAKPIAPREMQYHTLYPGTEDDCVAFTLPRGADVKIWTMGEIGGDTTISLRDSGGTIIATNDDGYYNAPYSYISNFLSPATYYVQVNEYWSTALPSYQILIETYDIDDYETNNTPATATPIASGDRLPCSIYPSGDEDWFTFTVSNRANVLLLTDTQNPFWLGDTTLTLLNSNMDIIVFNDDGNNLSSDGYGYSAIYWGNLTSGTYFVKVVGYGTDPDYYLSLDIYGAETVITNITLDTNGVRVAWPGDASFNYRIDMVTNLSQGVVSNLPWTAITNLEGRVGENRWTDPGTTSARWYRVVAP